MTKYIILILLIAARIGFQPAPERPYPAPFSDAGTWVVQEQAKTSTPEKNNGQQAPSPAFTSKLLYAGNRLR